MSAPSGSASRVKSPPKTWARSRRPAAANAALAERRHRRQVEQHQLQARCALPGGYQEATLAASDVQQAAVAVQRVGVQHLLRHQGLRGRHQRE
jgi:hypothetical protein